jgi:hypothetical protein
MGNNSGLRITGAQAADAPQSIDAWHCCAKVAIVSRLLAWYKSCCWKAALRRDILFSMMLARLVLGGHHLIISEIRCPFNRLTWQHVPLPLQ